MADNPQVLMAVSLWLILFSLIIIALFIIFVHPARLSVPAVIGSTRAGSMVLQATHSFPKRPPLVFPVMRKRISESYPIS
jgi:hypothetical protein